MGKYQFAILLTLLGSLDLVSAAPQDRIRRAIDSTRVVTLAQPVKAISAASVDTGRVAPDLMIDGVTVVLPPSSDQQRQLDLLLESQRDPSSPDFHRWLTPELFGDRFGATENDINAIAAWIRGQGLTVDHIARSKNYIVTSGTAAQMGRAFHTAIHYFNHRGEMNYSNTTPPSVPEALSGIVGEIRGLDNIRLKPSSAKLSKVSPQYTSGGAHYIAPDDWATIYNVSALYQSGLDGTGQKVVVVGQTDINMADIQAFRTMFKLPANPPTVVLTGTDPGISSGDFVEAELDVEWAGAVARNATIIYVNSTGVIASAQYAISQNLAPVISMSYGGCEPQNNSSLRTLAQQANAQGITWIASSGDSGAAGCDSSSASVASHGLAVNIPASFPEVTGIGGTTFAEGSGNYWNPSNGTNGGSALGYIPETSWNDTASRNELSSTGGGKSVFFTKPSWQAGNGVPADGRRDVPDISFTSSPDHAGYLFIVNNALSIVGGTSAPTPAFSGLLALLNQSQLKNGSLSVAGLGNINPSLYHLAQIAPGIFHDVTTGNNIVPCTAGTTNCTGGSLGYSAAVGYDLVTGLGSADLGLLVTGWNGVVASAGTTTSVSANPATITATGSTQITALVTATSGSSVPTGSVTFTAGSTSLGTASLSPSGTGASAALTVAGSSLVPGANTVSANYSGNSSFTGSSGSVTVIVNAAVPTATATFVRLDSTTQGNWRSSYGVDGYAVVGDQTVAPSYASPLPSGNANWTWAASTTDARALQKASNPADRIAAVWYSGTSFIVDSNITDQAQHQVALYCMDWDSSGRRQTVEVLDSNGTVLNTQALTTSFNGGVYLVWNVSGHVKFRLTWTGGYNAVMEGIFFGAGTTVSTQTATFVRADAATQGNWRSAYGSEGYNVIGDQSVNPAYAAPAVSGNSSWVWSSSTNDVRALQKASNTSDRIVAAWYSPNSFLIDTNITDQAQHQVALYCLDWDSTNRRQTVDVLDNAGNVLNTQTLSTSFNGGVYLVWNVTGHVKFRVNWTGGYNALVNGVFFGGASASTNPTATFVKADTTTQGTWRSVYGSEGYLVVNDQSVNPSYASPVTTGGSPWTWAASTQDGRALQKAANPSDRIASTYYSGSSFTIDTNITDQSTHQVALYCLDWDTGDRRQSVDVLDTNGNVLNTQTLSTSFNSGVYLVWNVTGHVKFRLNWLAGYNAVVAGVFFK